MYQYQSFSPRDSTGTFSFSLTRSRQILILIFLFFHFQENNARKKCKGEISCRHKPQCVPSSSHGVPTKDKQYKLPKKVVPKSRSQPPRVKPVIKEPLAQLPIQSNKTIKAKKIIVQVLRVEKKKQKVSENFPLPRGYVFLSNDSDDDFIF